MRAANETTPSCTSPFQGEEKVCVSSPERGGLGRGRLRWRSASALVCLALVIVAVGLGACGRKEKLTPPRGADYPRQYPRE